MLSEARAAKTKMRKRGGRGGGSDYGRQLIEKQRMRFTYGVSEKQFSNYVQSAILKAKDPQEALVASLETRLDNVVYRSGIASTRRQARQLVSHGHILVNGRKTNVPSYHVKVGDKISVRDGSKTKSYFENVKEAADDATPPQWLAFDAKAFTGELTSVPTIESIDLQSDLTEVFSFYSR